MLTDNMFQQVGQIWVFSSPCGSYDEATLRAIVKELSKRNAHSIAIFEANDPVIQQKLEEDASF